MENIDVPKIINILKDEGSEIRQTAYGRVGAIYQGEGVEAVWVKKEREEIDPGWFSQPMVDLIFVVQGSLKVEFEQPELETKVLEPGEMLVLPSNTRCRAYRWPREAQQATVFLAVYPTMKE